MFFYFLLWFILLGAFITSSHFTGITNSESTYTGKFDNKYSCIRACFGPKTLYLKALLFVTKEPS